MPQTKPEPHILPVAAHAARLPAHLKPEHLKRIKQAAFNLPHVVKPADFISEQTAGFETYLDGKGYILLQAAAAGARPSRWIAPDLLDLALQHLDEVGSGREVRTLMAQRTATLDPMGIQRSGSGWERLARQTLSLKEATGTDWSIQAYFPVSIDPPLVWGFYRNG